MNDEERIAYIIARLDFYFEIAECILEYFRKHTDISFDIARETYDITHLQLQRFIRENADFIFTTDELYNYYTCTIEDYEFIEQNLYNK